MTLRILLTNDDGIFAPGLAVLRAAVEGLGEVTTLAPDHNASAVARAITVRRTLHLTPATFGEGREGLACDGTPSDCVRVGLLGVACPVPGLVVSGVNAGGNMGADTTYSGTVGAAFEAALREYPPGGFEDAARGGRQRLHGVVARQPRRPLARRRGAQTGSASRSARRLGRLIFLA